VTTLKSDNKKDDNIKISLQHMLQCSKIFGIKLKLNYDKKQ